MRASSLCPTATQATGAAPQRRDCETVRVHALYGSVQHGPCAARQTRYQRDASSWAAPRLGQAPSASAAAPAYRRSEVCTSPGPYVLTYLGNPSTQIQCFRILMWMLSHIWVTLNPASPSSPRMSTVTLRSRQRTARRRRRPPKQFFSSCRPPMPQLGVSARPTGM